MNTFEFLREHHAHLRVPLTAVEEEECIAEYVTHSVIAGYVTVDMRGRSRVIPGIVELPGMQPYLPIAGTSHFVWDNACLLVVCDES